MPGYAYGASTAGRPSTGVVRLVSHLEAAEIRADWDRYMRANEKSNRHYARHLTYIAREERRRAEVQEARPESMTTRQRKNARQRARRAVLRDEMEARQLSA